MTIHKRSQTRVTRSSELWLQVFHKHPPFQDNQQNIITPHQHHLSWQQRTSSSPRPHPPIPRQSTKHHHASPTSSFVAINNERHHRPSHPIPPVWWTLRDHFAVEVFVYIYKETKRYIYIHMYKNKIIETNTLLNRLTIIYLIWSNMTKN